MTPFRLLIVREVRELGRQMRRIVFHGPDLADFPAGFEGGHCRLFFPRVGERPDAFVTQAQDGDRRPKRTYTIRHHDPRSAEIVIDFVLHGPNGIAGPWAARARPGDFLGLRGPGRRKLNVLDARFYLLCADDAGLPALAATAEALPRTAEGVALLSGAAIGFYPPVDLPPAMALHRVDTGPDGFVRWLSQRPPPGGGTVALVLAEGTEMRLTRRWLMDAAGLPKRALLTSGYWKRGLTEDELPRAKQSPEWFGDPVGDVA